MDEIAQYNTARWKALAEANAVYTRPYLQLDAASAREKLDPDGRLGEIKGKTVLCLAGGGGQQSAAFALLGAKVTVLDLSDEQLQQDRTAAIHYQIQIETLQGDMRDLSRLTDSSFDIVWQPYSLNFVHEVYSVFKEVARVLRPKGLYHFHCANPFYAGLGPSDWNGEGYILKSFYCEGAEITYPDQAWVSQSGQPIPPPREYRHTLSALLNGLMEYGFVIRHLSDQADFRPDPSAEPGTWDHFNAVAPPWLTIWAIYDPTYTGE